MIIIVYYRDNKTTYSDQLETNEICFKNAKLLRSIFKVELPQKTLKGREATEYIKALNVKNKKF